MKILKNDWADNLEQEFQQPYYIALREFLIKEYQTKVIYPNKHHIFNALHLTAYSQTKVVILGQDPYHGEGQAHGLSFSVQPSIAPPPSLQNIFKELNNDLGCNIPNHGCLVPWATQGVLLLNTVLSVRGGQANSHRRYGWENFTDKVISLLNQREQPIVFILWGKHAQEKQQLILSSKHLVIKSAHPSPFSATRGFFGSRPFSKTNEFLKKSGQNEINWQLPNHI